MKDSQENLVLGRTRWRRFAAVAGVATLAVTGLMAGVASGAIPVMLNVSGQTAKLSADKLDAQGFAQYPGFVTSKVEIPGVSQKKDINGDGVMENVIPVAASAIKSAKITNLCQSVRVPGTPLSLIIRGGTEPGKPVEASDLVIGMDYLAGDATFTNIDIGGDASTLNKGGVVGQVGDFGQQADSAVITGLQQRFYSTHAGTFHLTGLQLSIQANKECFADPVIK